MASITVVSTLSIDLQAVRLREFAHERGHELTDVAATAICATLNLSRPCSSSATARRLREVLASHRVHLTHTVALEGLARLCEGANWMRARQLTLSLNGQTGGSAVQAIFCLHPERYDDVKLQVIPRTAMMDLVSDAVDLVRGTWAADACSGICQLTVRAKSLLLEFEHPTAPWVTMKVWGFEDAGNDKGALPDLLELPAQDVHRFVAKLERALEYQLPGLLVFGGIRSRKLSPNYFFAPVFSMPATGFQQECAAPMDTLFWLGACKPEFQALPDGTFVLHTEDQEVVLRPSWKSQDTGESLQAPVDPDRLRAMMNRLERIQRISGQTLAEFLANGFNGRTEAGNVHVVERGKVHVAMERLELPPLKLAEKTGQPLNVVLRLVKYGYAPLESLPGFAEALGFQDPNELLPDESEQATGLRIETGASFLKALKKTHVWRRVIGDSIQDAEAEEINGIAEALQEYVELLQFSESTIRNHVKTDDARLLEPIDEERLARDIQELLDELAARGIAVIVSWKVRFMKGKDQLAHMDKFPLHQGTIYLERVEHLRTPDVSA